MEPSDRAPRAPLDPTAPLLTAVPVRAQALALPLPFDDGADDQVPFVLTAAAHREVLGRDVPPLVAVTGPPHEGTSLGPEPAGGHTEGPDPADDGGAPEAADTRRAQARALLRSGMPVATIAAALGVEAPVVETWTGDLVDELARRRRRSVRATRATPPAPAAVARAVSPAAATGSTERARLVPGLALALAQVTDDGVALVHDRVEPVRLLLDALREHLDPYRSRIRVAVRLGSGLAADRTCADLALALGVDASSITIGRGSTAAPDELLLRVDVRAPEAAHIVRTWIEGGRIAERPQRSRPAAAS